MDEERPQQRGRGSLGRFTPPVLVLLLAFLVTVDLRAQQVTSRASDPQRAELVQIIEQRQARQASLEASLQRLRAQLEARIAQSNEQGSVLSSALADASAAAGLTAVTGPGFDITLADARGARPGDPDTHIQDVDLQAIVNELWADGAEAIAVGPERVIATTSIREAGDAILVNFRAITAPYVVRAIGAPSVSRRFASSGTSRRYRSWAEIYGLGFSIGATTTESIPAFDGNLRARYARAT